MSYRTIRLEVSEQLFFVGEAVVVFEVVHGLFVATVLHQPIVFVASLGLLPLEVHKHGAVFFSLDPRGSALHDSANELVVIARAHIVLF